MNEMIKPTRMELVKLKNKLITIKRGYKLLKDKQDELVHTFMSMVYDTKELREQTDTTFASILNEFIKMKEKKTTVEMYEMVMIPSSKINLNYGIKNIMSVQLPKIHIKDIKFSTEQTYSDITSPLEIEVIKNKMYGLLPTMFELAEKEQGIFLMAEEISKTRRRVNVLENIMIPKLEDNIQQITMKLEENERGNVVRIMKSKEIVMEKVNMERTKRKMKKPV